MSGFQGGIEKAVLEYAASVRQLSAHWEAVGDAIDAALPGWEGNYPDAITHLASRVERLTGALRTIQEWTIGNAALTSPEREVYTIATNALAELRKERA